MSKQNGFRYVLANGNILQVCGEDFELYDKSGENIHIKKLTPKKKKLLQCLLEFPNQLVSYKKLYESYSQDEYLDKGDCQKVTKMFTGIDNRITGCIECTAAEGYSIFVNEKEPVIIDTSLSSTLVDSPASQSGIIRTSYDANTSFSNRTNELTGHYYGFYLDRAGSGSLLGAYLYIENCGNPQSPNMVVNAILGIRSTDILMGKEISKVFATPKNDYAGQFAQFRKKLSDRDRDCFLSRGAIIQHKAIVEITFDAVTDESWHIFVDLQGYFSDPREKIQDADFYRGGLGLAFAFWSEFGDTCFRFAFVRQSLSTPAMTLDSSFIRDNLKMTANGQGLEWNPIKLSSRMDKSWYNWFMKEHQAYLALSKDRG